MRHSGWKYSEQEGILVAVSLATNPKWPLTENCCCITDGDDMLKAQYPGRRDDMQQ